MKDDLTPQIIEAAAQKVREMDSEEQSKMYPHRPRLKTWNELGEAYRDFYRHEAEKTAEALGFSGLLQAADVAYRAFVAHQAAVAESTTERYLWERFVASMCALEGALGKVPGYKEAPPCATAPST